MIRLYSRLTSGNSYKIRLLLSILRIEHEIVPVEMEAGRNKVDWMAWSRSVPCPPPAFANLCLGRGWRTCADVIRP